ncbi:MAG: hypothetical protein DPW12_14920 [Rhodocyclaceae bacterium]|nr:hypothetical protein [Rhodocyclaceae bacterium]
MNVTALDDRITIEPGKRGGRPCIRGLRITVYDVLAMLAEGMTEACQQGAERSQGRGMKLLLDENLSRTLRPAAPSTLTQGTESVEVSHSQPVGR